MAIKVTASGNFENKKSWSGMKKHMEHDEKINHSNEFLNTEESKKLKQYNQHKILINYEEFVNSAFGSYVKEHDKNLKDKKRAYKSVDRFLKVDSTGKERELQPVQAYMEKFTDKETYEGILSVLEERLRHCHYRGHKELLTPAQAHDEALKAIATGLSNYADGFNERNPNLKMFEYHSHLDEEGAPHIHARVMPFSGLNKKTKTGKPKKPSWSLNAALRAQYGGASNKNPDRLAKFREQEDKALIESMNKSFEFLLGKDALELYRKTKVEHVTTGLSHEEYTAKKKNELRQEIDAKKAKIEEQNNKIAKNNVTLSNQKQAINSNNSTIADQQDDIDANSNAITNQRQVITANNNKIINQQNNINANNNTIINQRNDIDANAKTKAQQETDIKDNAAKITNQNEELSKLEKWRKDCDNKIDELRGKLKGLVSSFTHSVITRLSSIFDESSDDIQTNELKTIEEITKSTAAVINDIKATQKDLQNPPVQQVQQKSKQKQQGDDGLDM